jgi:hypothetical protein
LYCTRNLGLAGKVWAFVGVGGWGYTSYSLSSNNILELTRTNSLLPERFLIIVNNNEHWMRPVRSTAGQKLRDFYGLWSLILYNLQLSLAMAVSSPPSVVV